ncbi:RcnB family protein [Mycoplana rhizolycopersici]|jgi:Ni/Co efflux regulator RcnB|uniref:RcnB family protein n=1 Tax=Mycoplana rhizolycopersici TaxID=2746702 RepID=A0ABX2QL87_9HYPH|nr:RcnB family protein [Rhizobium rhizolycopersici]NVP57091.1 RcnB family protein [Rhizobium rhizolycopersici]
MKKLLTLLIATSVLATPLAAVQAQAQDHRGHQVERKVVTTTTTKTKTREVTRKHRWNKGNKLTRSERRQIINSRDYRRHHLHAPRRGEQWVRVDNQFLLISAATGLILGIAAAN